MKKLLLVGTSMLLLSTASAMAEVDIFADIDADKDIYVLEYINSTRTIDIDAEVDIDAEKAAESFAILNQENFANKACENCAEKTDSLTRSVNANEGVTNVNAASGNMNNQGNVISVAYDNATGTNTNNPPNNNNPPPAPSPGGFAEAQAHGEQNNYDNAIDSKNIEFRQVEAMDSITNNNGVTNVNISAGNMANQGNALSIAVAEAEVGVALSEADLGQLNTDNTVKEGGQFGITKDVKFGNSVNGNTGVTAVNATSGNMANQANITAIGVVQVSN